MDVPMAVCITVMLGKLSHIATGDQIAPWREPLSCSMPGALLAPCRQVLRCSLPECFVAFAGDYDIVWRRKLDSCTAVDHCRARTHLDFDGHAAVGRKRCKTLRQRRAVREGVKIFN